MRNFAAEIVLSFQEVRQKNQVVNAKFLRKIDSCWLHQQNTKNIKVSTVKK